MVNTKEYIGKNALVTYGGISIKVKILGTKHSYGNLRFLIKPILIVKPKGELWVENLELL